MARPVRYAPNAESRKPNAPCDPNRTIDLFRACISDETICHFRARDATRVSKSTERPLDHRSIRSNPGADLFSIRRLLAGRCLGFLAPSLFANSYTDGMVDVPGCRLVEFRPYLSCFSQLFRLRVGYMRRYRCRHLAAGAVEQGAAAESIVSNPRGCHLEYRDRSWSPIGFGWSNDR